MRTITKTELEKLQRLIDNGEEWRFYSWRIWKDTARPYILRLDNYECQLCKERGRHSRAEIVHHVKPLRGAPALALSVFDPDTGARQLVSVCKACHEAEHPEALRRKPQQIRADPLTVERWD